MMFLYSVCSACSPADLQFQSFYLSTLKRDPHHISSNTQSDGGVKPAGSTIIKDTDHRRLRTFSGRLADRGCCSWTAAWHRWWSAGLWTRNGSRAAPEGSRVPAGPHRSSGGGRRGGQACRKQPDKQSGQLRQTLFILTSAWGAWQDNLSNVLNFLTNKIFPLLKRKKNKPRKQRQERKISV